MPKYIDIVGNRYGNLIVLEKLPSVNRKVMLKCRCDCGSEFIVAKSKIAEGITISCKECGRKRQSEAIKKHGYYNEKLYAVWISMRQRCFNVNSKSYLNYGARGITVCESWNNDYLLFRKWSMENGYKDGLSIDRINNDGNYEPDNCRWVTNAIQSTNKRSNRIIEFNGTKCSVKEMAEKYGMTRELLEGRLSKGWTVEKSLTTPMNVEKSHKKITTR